jgi:glycerophosphoryl diester phosphodiesterase
VNVTWISHRGYKKSAVENTREAFHEAVTHGFSSLETDLRLSRDGHIVLHHDQDLRRLAQSNAKISDLTRKELAAIQLKEGSFLGAVMFLDQFVREYPGCSWTFDIKPEGGADTIRALHTWAKTQGIFDWICAQSQFVLWSASDELLLRALFPKASCYARETECWRAGLSAILGVPELGAMKPGRVYSLPAKLGPLPLFRSAIMNRFHKRHARVLAFLPESESDVRAALDAGVDEILTNGLPLSP